MDQTALTVVLVHRDEPGRCVDAARAFLAQDVPVHLVVVDNGSRPDALARVAAEVPGATIHPLGANRGFGPAANAGLAAWLAGGAGEWVALAPHDALPEVGCLRRLLDAVAHRPRAGLVSADFGAPTRPVVDRYFGGILAPVEDPVEDGDGWHAAGHPHGTLMLLRRPCLEDIGLFDERYFAYCEEADLGVRAERAGWEVGIVRGAIVRNPSLSVEAPVAEYLQLRNSLLLVRDHFGRYPAFIRFSMAVGSTAWLTLRRSRRTPIFSAAARGQAMVDFLRGRFGPPPDWLRRPGSAAAPA